MGDKKVVYTTVVGEYHEKLTFEDRNQGSRYCDENSAVCRQMTIVISNAVPI
jgi:hypothetical protein